MYLSEKVSRVSEQNLGLNSMFMLFQYVLFFFKNTQASLILKNIYHFAQKFKAVVPRLQTEKKKKFALMKTCTRRLQAHDDIRHSSSFGKQSHIYNAG